MSFNITSKHDSNSLRREALFDGTSQEIIAILQRSAQNAQALVAADECSITLLQPGESVLITYSTGQEPGEKLKRTHFPQDESIEDWAEQYRKALQLLNNAEQTSPVSSWLSVPLCENDIFIGMLCVRNSETGAFDSHIVKILSIFADQVTLTVSKLLKASSEVQKAIYDKTRFFSLITHELRSPLNAINGYLELAMSGVGGELNEQQYEFVQRARVGSEHLYALLENMLLISRADNSQMQLNREIIKLQDVIENAVEELELTASDQHIAIECTTTSTHTRIYADSVRLQQVLRNLVGNALNFTPAGGKITINTSIDQNWKNTVQPKQQDDEKMDILKLQVSDTGIGIAPEHQTRIFERFFQVPNESIGRVGGPGLGLAIVKMIVELHGGSVTVDSVPDQGSTFTCILPCVLP